MRRALTPDGQSANSTNGQAEAEDEYLTEVYAKFRCEIGRSLSLQFPAVYAEVARQKGCYFLNGQDYIQPGPQDGVHLDAASHRRLGEAIAAFIQQHTEEKP